jgi:NAD(P)-dependent dehydrogenase (short-subunit alcohol dehydrogenase family)
MNERAGSGGGRRIAVITGGTAGVGRATVRAFARRGYDVAILGRGPEGLEGARSEVESAGVRALPIRTDVADADQVYAAAERVEAELGPIDVWVNDAMTTIFSPVTRITPGEFRRATEVTYLGTVYGTMAALRHMRSRDRGCIVQVGSALAYRAIPLQAPYCGAKHAIRGFTDSLRCELLHDGSSVHITAVHLPALNTPQFVWCRTRLPNHPQPVPPIFQPEVAADAILFAAEHRRREVWVGAPTYKVILGNKLAPGLADRYLARTGYDSQQTDEPVDPDRPDNLFKPVEGDHGPRGPFTERSRASSNFLWATKHRGLVLTGTLVLAAAIIAGLISLLS